MLLEVTKVLPTTNRSVSTQAHKLIVLAWAKDR